MNSRQSYTMRTCSHQRNHKRFKSEFPPVVMFMRDQFSDFAIYSPIQEIPRSIGFCYDLGAGATREVICVPSRNHDTSECPFLYRGTSLIRKRLPLGPYCRPIPRALPYC